MVRLPVTGLSVVLRQPTGAEDILVLETRGEARSSVALVERVAARADGAPLDVPGLPAPDLERLMLELRRDVLGDVIAARAQCPALDCAAAVDVSFKISEYVAGQRPRIPAGVEPIQGDSGWFALASDGVEFRLVTAGDLAETEEVAHPERQLVRRAIRPVDAPRRAITRAQRAMDAMSPCLPREIAGRCPDCGTLARFAFHPLRYVHAELRHQATSVFEDVHVLAHTYHWPEDKILALPRSRRLRYTELALWAGEAS